MRFQSVNAYRLAWVLLLLTLYPSKLIWSKEWSLAECIDSAKIYNKSLEISRNNIDLTELKKKEVISNLFPKVNSNAEYKYYIDLPSQLMPQSAFGGPVGMFKETQFGVPHNINASIQFALPVYNSEIYGGISKARIINDISILQSEKTEEQVIYDISIIYYNLQILLKQIEFIEGNLENNNKLLLNVELLYENLLAKKTDVERIKLLISQLKTQKEQLKSKVDKLYNSLKLQIGITVESEIYINTNINFHENGEYKTNSIIDILLVKEQNKLLHSDLKNLFLSITPKLNIIGVYGQTGYGYNESPNEFLDFYPYSFVGVQLSFPIFEGMTKKKKIAQKRIELKNNELQTQLLENQNQINIQNAYSQRSVAVSTINNTNQNIELAKELYHQTILQHQEGLASITDILLADISLREAQQNYLNAVIEYLKSDIELKKYTSNLK
ncbi:MAG: transporter [Ignavibacteria bacterium GWF2_33_9]|nr:MAG: transporter [Ignavibacteria bacterium GWF2_33_9]